MAVANVEEWTSHKEKEKKKKARKEKGREGKEEKVGGGEADLEKENSKHILF